ncbi:MAG: hypothetical protein U0793_31105 [Gemmataceae bacterium]
MFTNAPIAWLRAGLSAVVAALLVQTAPADAGLNVGSNAWISAGKVRHEFLIVNNGVWAEYINGKKTFTFVEKGRDPGVAPVVELYDSSRRITVALHSSTAYVSKPGKRPVSTDYTLRGQFIRTIFEYSGGSFTRYGVDGRWLEYQPALNARFEFREVSWSASGRTVTLYDATRGLTVRVGPNSFGVFDSAHKSTPTLTKPGHWVQ